MTKTIMANTQTTPNASSGTGATQYLGLIGSQGFSATEVNRQTSMLTIGEMSNLFLILTANTVAATSTFTFRKNTVDGNLTVSVGSNTTGIFEDTTHTDSIASGDKVNIKSVPGAAVGAYSYSVVSTHFQSRLAVDNTATHLGTACGMSVAESITTFLTLSSEFAEFTGAGETTEANTKLDMRRPGTFKNASVNITVNTTTNPATYTFRLNGANTALTTSIPAASTGFFENTVNLVSVVVGDDVNHQVVTGAGTGLVAEVRDISIEFYTNDGYAFGQAADVNESNHGTIFTRQGTSFLPIVGGVTSELATESNMQIRMRNQPNFSFTDLSCLVSANTNADNSTLVFRVNGVDGNNTVSITGLTTGYFQDTSHLDIVAVTDLVCLKLVTGTGAGTQSTTISYTHVAYQQYYAQMVFMGYFKAP